MKVETQAWGGVFPGTEVQAQSIAIDGEEVVLVGGPRAVELVNQIADALVE